jgi:hypothetical protein
MLYSYSYMEEETELIIKCVRQTLGRIACLQDDQGGNLLSEALSCEMDPFPFYGNTLHYKPISSIIQWEIVET